MSVITVTNDNFEEEVLKSEIPVLLDFRADWCTPCKMMAPVLEEIEREFSGKIKVGKVNVDEEAALALKYQVMSIPMFIVMKHGVFEGKTIGVQTKEELLAFLNL